MGWVVGQLLRDLFGMKPCSPPHPPPFPPSRTMRHFTNPRVTYLGHVFVVASVFILGYSDSAACMGSTITEGVHTGQVFSTEHAESEAVAVGDRGRHAQCKLKSLM
jgi:hypothetical protein